MVGGTAIALHIGHRVSIDFDLFTSENVNILSIKKQVVSSGFSSNIIVQKADQIHFTCKTYFFSISFCFGSHSLSSVLFQNTDLLTLAAMKAFALGGKGKWKARL